MPTEMDLLQTILKEIQEIKADFAILKQTTQQSLVELKTDIKFTHGVLGELQGDIEEIQADTEYLAMRKLIDKKRSDRILQRFSPPSTE